MFTFYAAWSKIYSLFNFLELSLSSVPFLTILVKRKFETELWVSYLIKEERSAKGIIDLSGIVTFSFFSYYNNGSSTIEGPAYIPPS